MISRKKQLSLIILCWAVYTIAYLGRYSYTSNGVPIQKFYGVSKEEFSLATTFFFFAYGAGQILNGLLCRKYNMRFMIFGAMIVSSAINISVFIGIPFYLIKYIWLINGLCQSILWASLLRILSCYLDDKNMNLAVLFMSTTVSIGTFIIYGASAFFALFDGFKYVFLVAAAFMTAVALIWIFSFGNLTEKLRLENAKTVDKKTDGATADAAGDNLKDNAYSIGNDAESGETQKPVRTALKGTVKGLIFLVSLFGLYAIVLNFAKDGLTTWLPQILNEQYDLSDSLSIILTIVLPLFAVFGAVTAVFVNKFVKDHSDLTGVFFAAAAVSMLGIALLLKTDMWYLVLILFGVVNMLMHGANNVVTSMLPLSVGKKYNAGTVGGLLNGTCYIGSTLSQYLIAYIATASGWSAVVNVLLYACVISAAFAAITFVIRKLKNKNIRNGETI